VDANDVPVPVPASPTSTSPKFYEETLLRLLERLDGVESDGDDVIRFTRRSLARELADELEAVDKAKAEQKDTSAVVDGVKVEVEVVEVAEEAFKEVEEKEQVLESTPSPPEESVQDVHVFEAVAAPQHVLDSASTPEAQAEDAPISAPEAEEEVNAEWKAEADLVSPSTSLEQPTADSELIGELGVEAEAEDTAHTFPPRANDNGAHELSLEVPAPNYDSNTLDINTNIESTTTASSASDSESDSQSEVGSSASAIEADGSPQQALTELGSDIVILTDDDDEPAAAQGNVSESQAENFEVL